MSEQKRIVNVGNDWPDVEEEPIDAIEFEWTDAERNSSNFSLAEWQQAKRTHQEPKVIKATFQTCWAASDSHTSLAAALREHGYELAPGRPARRRGHRVST